MFFFLIILSNDLYSFYSVSLDTAVESEAEIEVVKSIVLVRGVGAWQAGDLAAQTVSSLDVQGAVVPRLLQSNKAGVMDGHVGDTGEGKSLAVSTGH